MKDITKDTARLQRLKETWKAAQKAQSLASMANDDDIELIAASIIADADLGAAREAYWAATAADAEVRTIKLK